MIDAVVCPSTFLRTNASTSKRASWSLNSFLVCNVVNVASSRVPSMITGSMLCVRNVAICNMSTDGFCSVFCNVDEGPCLYINMGKYSLCVSLPVLLHNSHP